MIFTKQKLKLEEALKNITNSEEKYSNLVKSLPFPILELDQDLKLIYFNDFAKNKLKIKDEIYFSEFLIFDEYNKIKLSIEKFLKSSTNYYTTQVKIINYKVEFKAILHFYKVDHTEKKVIRCSIVDISELTKIQDDLISSEAKLRAILNSTKDAILLINVDGTIVEANSESFNLINFEKLNLKELLKNDSLFKAEWNNALLGHKRTFEWGKETICEIYLHKVNIANKVMMVATIRDITYRRKYEINLAEKQKALQKSNAELNEFTRIVSHDLKEPLRTNLAFLDLIEKKIKGKIDKETDEYLANINKGSNKMIKLITDLLVYSRVTTNMLNLTECSLNEIVQEAEFNLRYSIDSSNAKIKYSNLPVVFVDKTLVSLLFQNLISNSIKFHKQDTTPEIEISYIVKNDSYVFFVADKGIGIDSAFNEKVFTIFKRFHTSFPGTGLGLAICKKIVEQHDGKIWFDSKVNEGTTFYFTLPTKNVIK